MSVYFLPFLQFDTEAIYEYAISVDYRVVDYGDSHCHLLDPKHPALAEVYSAFYHGTLSDIPLRFEVDLDVLPTHVDATPSTFTSSRETVLNIPLRGCSNSVTNMYTYPHPEDVRAETYNDTKHTNFDESNRDGLTNAGWYGSFAYDCPVILAAGMPHSVHNVHGERTSISIGFEKPRVFSEVIKALLEKKLIKKGPYGP